MDSSKKTSYLVMVRHGQSEWNAKNLFTGWKDPDLTEKGIAEAENAGRDLKKRKIVFDKHYTSDLLRAQRTGEIILSVLGQENILTIKNKKLNERDYGDLAGLNKDEARKKWGEEQVHIWRRSYDTPPPGGESLKDTSDRVLPYFSSNILPALENGENIIICAHGNSLRSLVMSLEKLSPEEIVKIEIETGVPMVFEFNGDFLRIA